MRFTKNSPGYDDSLVYLDGRKIVDYAWADEETGKVMEITGKDKQELRRGKKLEIILNAGSSRF